MPAIRTEPPRRRDEASDPTTAEKQQAQRRQHHRRENDAERGPRLLPARRQSRKPLLNGLKIGFDRGKIGALTKRCIGVADNGWGTGN